MIRLHAVLLLLLAQAVFSERLVLQLATGGRGVVTIITLLDPWATILLVVLPFWKDLRRTFWTKPFLFYWMPYLALASLLPVLGVLVGGYPLRSAYASYAALNFGAFLAIGGLGTPRIVGRENIVARYLLFAVLAQLAMASIQSLGQFGHLSGPLKAIYDWDFQFKVRYMSDNVILGRSTGFYLNPNALGIWALITVWTCFFLLDGAKKVIGVSAAFATILLCQSRGTLAAFLGSATIYGISWIILRANRRQRMKATLLGAFLAIPLLTLTVSGLPQILASEFKDVPVVGRALERYVSGAKVLSEGASADANFKGRTEYWKAAFRYLSENPLGSLGSPQMVVLVPPDNELVGVLEQGSFYYLAALLLVYFGAMRLIGSAHRLSRLLATISIGMLINGVSAVPFAYPASYLFWLLAGAYLARRLPRTHEAPRALAAPSPAGPQALAAGRAFYQRPEGRPG